MTTVRVITFGCKVNQCDGEGIARELAARGYQVVGRGEAEVYVVNTCTVTGTADAKARKLIHKIAREEPEAVLVVTGCYAERDPEGLAAIPGVDAVVGHGRKGEVVERISQRRSAGESGGHVRLGRNMPALQGRVRAFVKVQDGCDHRCAYCIVPEVRGRPASRPMAEVVGELRALVKAGTAEVVLCGIRLGTYGRELGEDSLAALLQEMRPALSSAEGSIGIPRIRLSSLEPMDVDDALIAEMADHPTLCHHLHLPLQSGDDGVLEAMGRGYTSGQFAELAAKVREVWPEAGISTDVMVGFPGETEEQFGTTVQFVRRVGLSRLHVFPFSARPGTAAARRRDQIPAMVKRTRAERMLAVGEELAQKSAEAWVGREVKALIEERGRDGLLTGWTEQYIRVTCEGPEECIGMIVSLKPTEARGGELVACGVGIAP